MPLINCKVELKLKWTEYFVLFAVVNDNINDRDSDNIAFTIKDTKRYVPVVTLLAKDNQKLSIYIYCWNLFCFVQLCR